ncbi:MAG TPA: Uma2 family endonuclease [Dehalococcoidia bacterium]|nr:Uma2 family endonuclease [Dehalococcoidia bacterium]
MATTKKPITAEELFEMDDCDAYVELIEGELQEMTPPPGWEHGHTTSTVGLLIAVYVRANRLGQVAVGDPGIILKRDPDTVRGPDVAFISSARLPPDRSIPGYPEIAPDLVVEVVSPGDRAGRIQQKVAQWLAAGVRLVWVVYPLSRHVVAYRELAHPRVYTEEETIDAEPVLPGFSCAVAEFFA